MPFAVGAVVVLLSIEASAVTSPWITVFCHLDVLDEVRISTVMLRKSAGDLGQVA